MTFKRIRLAPEFGAGPLWDDETGLPINFYEELPISDDLKQLIDVWDIKYQSILNQNYPPDSAFIKKADEEAYIQERDYIYTKLKAELPEIQIVMKAAAF